MTKIYNLCVHKNGFGAPLVCIVQRRCASWYEKSREEQSREAGNAAAKKIKTFCSDCDAFLS